MKKAFVFPLSLSESISLFLSVSLVHTPWWTYFENGMWKSVKFCWFPLPLCLALGERSEKKYQIRGPSHLSFPAWPWSKAKLRPFIPENSLFSLHLCKRCSMYVFIGPIHERGKTFKWRKRNLSTSLLYRGGYKGLFVLLSRTQAGPGRTVKQEQGEISRNHVQTFIYLSVPNLYKFWGVISRCRDVPDAHSHSPTYEQ